MRDQLTEARASLARATNEFSKVREPAIRSFIASLQSFAQSNRDFQPVFDRYRRFLFMYYPPSTPVAGGPPSVPGK
jgi:hypothetical protein